MLSSNRPAGARARSRLASACFALAFGVTLAVAGLGGGCAADRGSPGGTDAGRSDAFSDAAAERSKDASRPPDQSADAGAPFLVELRVARAGASSSALVPGFSKDVHDYYVRCAPGANLLTVTMKASAGAESRLTSPTKSASLPEQTIASLPVMESQAIVATASTSSSTVEYWVRCLPDDFPDISVAAHPEAGTPEPGYYLLGNFVASGATGGYAMVLNSQGVPVWYFKEPSGGVSDVEDVVKGAVSFIRPGTSFEVHSITPPSITHVAPAGTSVDFHELRVLPNGDDIVVSSPVERGFDLTGLGLPSGDGGTIALGPDASIDGCDVVEFDPKSGAVVWTWKATDHFDPAKDCTEPALGGGGAMTIDTFHCNSVDVDPANGNLLVSARQMDSVFYIERLTGKVLWKMGGAKASKDGAVYVPVDSAFYGQHDARLAPGWSACGGQISLFDDQTFGVGRGRAALYRVSVDAADGGCDGGADGGPSATLEWQYVGAAFVQAGGSFRVAVDGSRVVGWGLGPGLLLSEVDLKGDDLLDMMASPVGPYRAMESYRAVKVPLTAFDLEAMRTSAGK